MPVFAAARVAIRGLVRRPGYAAMVIAILGIGLGANTAIFGIVDAVLLRSLPYGQPESLVVVWADGSARGQAGHSATTPGDLSDWREQTDGVFSDLAAVRNMTARITSLDSQVVPLVHAVSANYFKLLDAKPLLGRVFEDGEDRPGRDGEVMMSYGLWQAKFGGDPSIVGRTIDLDARPFTVIGIMTQDFYSAHIFNVQPDLWIPYGFDRERDDRVTRDVIVYGRLRPGTSMTAAQAATRTIAARIATQHPDTNDRWSIALVPLREHVVGAFTRIAMLVLSAVGLVLVIVCANVTNLALARGVERTSDIAVRTALGASRVRIAIDVLVESLVLSAFGGLAGVLLARLAMPALVRMIPDNAGVPFLHRATIDARVLTFELAAILVCSSVAALLPIREAAPTDIVTGLRAGGRGSISRSSTRWRRTLVSAEVALAVVVIVCAALMARTLIRLDNVPNGFHPERIAKLRTSVRGDALSTPAGRVAHFDELKRRLEQLVDVDSVSGINYEPPNPAGLAAARLRIPGRSDDRASVASAFSRVILPDYFATMGIPVLRGRGITAIDHADSARVVVISQLMAQRYFSGVDPIGRTFAFDTTPTRPLHIVGIVGDVMSTNGDPAPQPTFYVPYSQSPGAVMTMLMRVPRGEVSAPLQRAEKIAWSVSPFVNVYGIGTLSDWMDVLNWRPRFAATVLSGFALLALFLAAA